MNEPIPITARQGMWGTVGTEVPTEHSTAHAVVRPRCAPLVRCDFPAIAVTKRFQRQRGRSRGWAERRKLRRQLVRLRLRNHAHLAERFPNLTERPGAARRCSSDGPVLQARTRPDARLPVRKGREQGSNRGRARQAARVGRHRGHAQPIVQSAGQLYSQVARPRLRPCEHRPQFSRTTRVAQPEDCE